MFGSTESQIVTITNNSLSLFADASSTWNLLWSYELSESIVSSQKQLSKSLSLNSTHNMVVVAAGNILFSRFIYSDNSVLSNTLHASPIFYELFSLGTYLMNETFSLGLFTDQGKRILFGEIDFAKKLFLFKQTLPPMID